MAHINEHIPSHCRELRTSKRADSTSHLCFPVLDPLILHHDSREHFSCAYEDTFQWPLRNPQQWSKPSGIKEKDYWTFKSYSFPSSNLKYNSSCINLIYSRSSILIYSSIFLWEHYLEQSTLFVSLYSTTSSWFNQHSPELPRGQKITGFSSQKSALVAGWAPWN